jgi:hypothetical protein
MKTAQVYNQDRVDTKNALRMHFTFIAIAVAVFVLATLFQMAENIVLLVKYSLMFLIRGTVVVDGITLNSDYVRETLCHTWNLFLTQELPHRALYASPLLLLYPALILLYRWKAKRAERKRQAQARRRNKVPSIRETF